MKKTFSILFLLSIIASVHAEINPGNTPDNGFNRVNILTKIKEVDDSFTPPKGDFKLFEKQFSEFGHLGIFSIPVTENLVNKYLDTFSESDRDSVYVAFNYLFYVAVTDFNDSLDTKYSTLLHKIINKIADPEINEFKKALDMCGLTLLVSEGDYYVDARYDYFSELFKDRVSPALNDFLQIRRKELKEGFSEDAGLLISFNQLYDRVVTWENFNTKYPDFFDKTDSQFYYKSYLSTLITGLDNSQPFDDKTGELIPELKRLYQKIISRDDSLNSTRVIRDYYGFLKASDFKEPKNLDKFLKVNDLYSMIGVQPETR